MCCLARNFIIIIIIMFFYYVLLRHNGSKTHTVQYTHMVIHANTSTKKTQKDFKKQLKTVKRNRTVFVHGKIVCPLLTAGDIFMLYCKAHTRGHTDQLSNTFPAVTVNLTVTLTFELI